VGGLQDGQWHRVSLGVSVWGLEVYVDCSLLESVRWPYRRQGISTQGLVMLGGILESFETPFEVRGRGDDTGRQPLGSLYRNTLSACLPLDGNRKSAVFAVFLLVFWIHAHKKAYKKNLYIW